MDAFSKITSSLGSGGGFGGGLSALTSLMGIISQMSMASKEKALMDRSVYYSKHPEVVSSMVKSATQPLSAGLTKGVENIVSGSLAEQGLSQAPGIQSQVLAQALAPYMQNEQQMALQQVLSTIGMPLETLSAMKGINDPNSLAMLLKGILPKSSTPYGTGGTSPYDDPSITGPTQGDVGIAPDWAKGMPDIPALTGQ